MKYPPLLEGYNIIVYGKFYFHTLLKNSRKNIPLEGHYALTVSTVKCPFYTT